MESRSVPQSTIIGEETHCLPEQLITEEILPRLPVKSLLKFRCVSKSWCSLIDSKRFMKAHLKYSIKSSKFNHHWIFHDTREKEFNQCSLPSLFDKPFNVPIYNVDLGINFMWEWVSAVGCCNGLVCILVSWKRFILWNPTTKKFKNLPDLYNLIQVKCGIIVSQGFGFDELSDDYKVFGIVNQDNATGAPIQCIGMIYSLRSNSWKHIEETDHVSPFGDKGKGMGIYVSGKLHWYGNTHDIVSFGLNRHVSGVVELPSYTKGVLHSVGVVEGCLSAHFLHPNKDLDVWLMKEYGVKESWNKVVTVPCYEYNEIPIPVAIAPNGEVLLIRNKTVVIYNPKSDVLRHPQITSFDDGVASFVCSLGICIESLASVAPDAQ